MSSGEDIANKGSYHYQEEKYNPNVSCLFVQIGAIVKASSDVEVKADKEERGTVGVEVSNESAVIDVSADVGDG